MRTMGESVFVRSEVRYRAARYLEQTGSTTIPALVRAGIAQSRQAAHKALCLPWFEKQGRQVVLTKTGRRALNQLRK